MTMLQVVVEDIRERVAHFAWRAEIAAVIPIAPNSALSPEHAIQLLRERNDEASHAAIQHAGRSFDDEMKVVFLNREVRNAKAAADPLRLRRKELLHDSKNDLMP